MANPKGIKRELMDLILTLNEEQAKTILEQLPEIIDVDAAAIDHKKRALEARRQYQREYRKRRLENPEYRVKDNEYRRQYVAANRDKAEKWREEYWLRKADAAAAAKDTTTDTE